MYLGVETSLAVAHAGLGDFDAAKQLLDRLLTKHAPNRGPLTLGALHDAYLDVALKERNLALGQEQLTKLEAWDAPLNLPSLGPRIDSLQRQLRALQRSLDPEAAKLPLAADMHLVTRIQTLLTGAGALRSERAQRAVQIAAELTGADDAFIVFQSNDGA